MDTKKKIDIVLAEDNELERLFFKKAIAQLNLNISLDMLEDGESLMAFLTNPSRKQPDILFLDLKMPDMDGLRCLQLIRNDPKLKDMAVAVYSSSTDPEVIEACLVGGANIYIQKPHDLNQLIGILHKAITVNYHYEISGQSKENFVMVI